jgi:hypothetical protein
LEIGYAGIIPIITLTLQRNGASMLSVSSG